MVKNLISEIIVRQNRNWINWMILEKKLLFALFVGKLALLLALMAPVVGEGTSVGLAFRASH